MEWEVFADRGIIPARAGFTREDPLQRRGQRDHPRSRGVYASRRRTATRSSGSSPLARGLLYCGDLAHARRGIIPARAGFTSRKFLKPLRWRDHPRSRGVYSTIQTARAWQMGSSPLARGLHGQRVRVLGFARIIPARAGFTLPIPAPPGSPPDHPRSRGVYSRVMVAATRRMGSSPLARGLRTAASLDRDLPGIIPVRAGFTPL